MERKTKDQEKRKDEWRKRNGEEFEKRKGEWRERKVNVGKRH